MDDTELKSSKGPLAWMTQNHVAANLVMLLLLLGGMVVMPRVKQQTFPDFDLDMVEVKVAYPGASPEEVEQGTVLAVEEAVRGLDGIKAVTSTAREGMATINIELLLDVDVDSAVADVKSAVDRVTSFPADVEKPEVRQATRREIPVALVVTGNVSDHTLREMAESARTDLLADGRVTQAEVRMPPAREISIEVPQANLRAYKLTIAQIADAIRSASVELPGGGVKTLGGEVLVRTAERRNVGSEFEEIVISSRPDGTSIRVKDIATVVDGFEENGAIGRFNGQPALLVELFRVGKETPSQIAQAADDYIAKATPKLPPGVELHPWGHFAKSFEGRIDLLLRNAYLGLILVMLVLGAFLNIRLAFWVTMGIPISFIGSILIFPGFDVSFNMVSLFAFIIALGMVVDDAIVVGESIYNERREGHGMFESAVVGVRRVAVPVVFSVGTTIVAFMPLLFVPGMSGKFLRNVPLIVMAVLFISLIESIFILPAHLGHTKTTPSGGFIGWLERGQGHISRGLERFIENIYRPFVAKAARRRYLTLATAVACLIASAGLVAGGRLKFTFMPQIDRDNIDIALQLPNGSPKSALKDVMDQVTAGCDRVIERNGTRAGLQAGMFATLIPATSLISVSMEMPPIDVREIPIGEFKRQWQHEIAEIPGIESVSYDANRGPGPRGVDMELSHTDMHVLEQAAVEFAAALSAFEGVTNVNDGFAQGKEQLDLKIRPQARTLGVTATSLGRQLRGAFFGEEALRQQRGRDEIRVYVRRPLSERNSEHHVERFLVQTPDGGEIPLGVAAELTRGRAFTEIKRKDGRRIVNVKAELDSTRGNANEIVAAVMAKDLPALAEKYPGLSYEPGGSSRGQRDTMGSLGPNYLLALIGIFMMLAIIFRSYVQPIVVMLAIPFGFIGAIWGHWLMGYNLSLISMMGIVALSGVVVNDSLVLIVAVNEYRAGGMSAYDAVVAGGTRRFRPIMLTSLTTFFGLAPMLTETSTQARFLIPMAISLAFGILAATVLILVAVPAGYLAIEDAKRGVDRGWAWLMGREAEPEVEPEPAE